jgi:competence protein ComEC
MNFNRQKISLYILSALFLGAVLVWSAVWQNGAASIVGQLGDGSKLKIEFFDVGQGNAVFIEAPNGNRAIIDGGPGSQILNKLGHVLPFFDRDIDVVVLTHPDADHLDGLIDVLKKYKVGGVIDSCLAEPKADYQEFLRLIEEKKISHLCAQSGQTIKLDDDATLDILFPFASLEGISLLNTNDGSIVAKLIYGQNEILLTGDAEKKTEIQLINAQADLGASILQVGHHGSKSSTSAEFLQAVHPEMAIIQVGKNNRYGHPTQEVLDRLTAVGAKIFRTDSDGDVDFLCDLEKCERE